MTNADRLISRLRRELWRQWKANHEEHCGARFDAVTLSHDGLCSWRAPKVLVDIGAKEHHP